MSCYAGAGQKAGTRVANRTTDAQLQAALTVLARQMGYEVIVNGKVSKPYKDYGPNALEIYAHRDPWVGTVYTKDGHQPLGSEWSPRHELLLRMQAASNAIWYAKTHTEGQTIVAA